MKEIKLLIPEGQRIGEAIFKAILEKIRREEGFFPGDEEIANRIAKIEDQDLLSLLSQPK